ncbi:MAG: ribosomal protein L7/L12 [Eubacterium sp.]|nr:ribosomal protein L7/L12 [Eubacterium sp.]
MKKNNKRDELTPRISRKIIILNRLSWGFIIFGFVLLAAALILVDIVSKNVGLALMYGFICFILLGIIFANIKKSVEKNERVQQQDQPQPAKAKLRGTAAQKALYQELQEKVDAVTAFADVYDRTVSTYKGMSGLANQINYVAVYKGHSVDEAVRQYTAIPRNLWGEEYRQKLENAPAELYVALWPWRYPRTLMFVDRENLGVPEEELQPLFRFCRKEQLDLVCKEGTLFYSLVYDRYYTLEDGTAPDVKQTRGAVLLIKVGASKIAVIKALREAAGMSLPEARTMVDGAPRFIKGGNFEDGIFSEEEATALKEALEAAGAEADIKVIQ